MESFISDVLSALFDEEGRGGEENEEGGEARIQWGEVFYRICLGLGEPLALVNDMRTLFVRFLSACSCEGGGEEGEGGGEGEEGDRGGEGKMWVVREVEGGESYLRTHILDMGNSVLGLTPTQEVIKEAKLEEKRRGKGGRGELVTFEDLVKFLQRWEEEGDGRGVLEQVKEVNGRLRGGFVQLGGLVLVKVGGEEVEREERRQEDGEKNIREGELGDGGSDEEKDEDLEANINDNEECNGESDEETNTNTNTSNISCENIVDDGEGKGDGRKSEERKRTDSTSDIGGCDSTPNHDDINESNDNDNDNNDNDNNNNNNKNNNNENKQNDPVNHGGDGDGGDKLDSTTENKKDNDDLTIPPTNTNTTTNANNTTNTTNTTNQKDDLILDDESPNHHNFVYVYGRVVGFDRQNVTLALNGFENHHTTVPLSSLLPFPKSLQGSFGGEGGGGGGGGGGKVDYHRLVFDQTQDLYMNVPKKARRDLIELFGGWGEEGGEGRVRALVRSVKLRELIDGGGGMGGGMGGGGGGWGGKEEQLVGIGLLPDVERLLEMIKIEEMGGGGEEGEKKKGIRSLVEDRLLEMQEKWVESVDFSRFSRLFVEESASLLRNYVDQGPVIVEQQMGYIKWSLETMKERVSDRMERLINGQRKEEVCNWWLTHIDGKVRKFLELIGYKMHLDNPDYLDHRPPPQDEVGILKNLNLISQVFFFDYYSYSFSYYYYCLQLLFYYYYSLQFIIIISLLFLNLIFDYFIFFFLKKFPSPRSSTPKTTKESEDKQDFLSVALKMKFIKLSMTF